MNKGNRNKILEDILYYKNILNSSINEGEKQNMIGTYEKFKFKISQDEFNHLYKLTYRYLRKNNFIK